MDDRPEREAALRSLERLSGRILQACQDEDEMVDALEELEVVTREEKNDANEADDYTGVIEKFRQKVDSDPEFFTKFCAHIQSVEALSDIAVDLTRIFSEHTLHGQSSPSILVTESKGDGQNKVEDGNSHTVDSSPTDSGDVPPPLPKVDVPQPPPAGGEDPSPPRPALDIPKPLRTDDHLIKLKERLIVFHELPCETDEGKEDILRMTKRAIKSFITTSLDEGVEATAIYTDLKNIFTKSADIVVDGAIYQWSMRELEIENKKRHPDSSSLQEMIHSLDAYSSDDDEQATAISPLKEFEPFNEINFSKVVVQNSIFACHLLDKSDNVTHMEHMAHTNFLCELNKSEPLKIERKTIQKSKVDEEIESLEPFTVVSVIPVEDETGERLASTEIITAPIIKSTMAKGGHAVHRYIIAKGASESNNHVVYYIAFSSHPTLREWKESHASFEDGLRKQQEQLPTQFIMERLWGGASVVLTGFSFGGSLAQLCGVTLYSQSQGVCSELLERNLLCVTFGQPVLSLPGTTGSADKIINKSRFHAVYIADDKLPRLLSHMDPACTGFADADMPEKLKNQVSTDDIFQNMYSTFIIKQLIILQEKYKDDKTADVVYADEKAASQQADSDGHRPAEEAPQQVTVQRGEGDSNSVQATRNLRALLKKMKRQIRTMCGSYVTYQVLDSGDFFNRDLDFQADADIKEDMFARHNTKIYLQVITKDYTLIPPKVELEQTDELQSSKFIIPLLKRLEVHHFSHHERTALSLEGENLCFTMKFDLSLHKSQQKHTLTVAKNESVSSRSIQMHEVPVCMPRELEDSSDSNLVNSNYQESEEKASVTLFTHFGEFKFEDVEVKHKKFYISCRRRQVANLSVAEVIELSFLGALLEQQPQSQSESHCPSKRYTLIEEFLEGIINVVPIESAFSCIANINDDEKGQKARHLCQVLKAADVKPSLSINLFMNTASAISKLRGDVVASSESEAASLEDLFFTFVVVAKRRAAPWLWWKETDEARYLKWFRPDIATHSRNSDMVKYLQGRVEEAIKQSRGKISALSGDSIKLFFDATKKLSTSRRNPMHTTLLSPKCLLSDKRKELLQLQREARRQAKVNPQSFARMRNAMLLDFVKKLRNEDLNMCIQTITAFMKEEVRIPISEFHLNISYWQLLIKFGLGIFRRNVSKDYATDYVSVGKHIKEIAMCATTNSEYADKLQFLLRSSLHQDEELPLFDDKFMMYSLEDHLHSRFTDPSVPKNQRINESTSLDDIVEKWDTMFRDAAMSSVVQSHRRLVASWLKFSLMVHRLRTELSCHTTLGIVGLVNSGKSTLVKELFQIKAVETGTMADKRTTVPFLYSIPGVDNFDVIDFPGVDDQDDHISDLVNLLRTLAQLVVFVVNYRNAHTRAAVEWYKKLNQYAIPHLVCLTHGDRLYAECVTEREGKGNRSSDKVASTHGYPNYREIIAREMESIREKITSQATDSPLRCLGLFSLKVDNDSKLKTPEGHQNIVDAGIKGLKDIGRWIVKALEDDIKEQATAQLLKTHFKLS